MDTHTHIYMAPYCMLEIIVCWRTSYSCAKALPVYLCQISATYSDLLYARPGVTWLLTRKDPQELGLLKLAVLGIFDSPSNQTTPQCLLPLLLQYLECCSLPSRSFEMARPHLFRCSCIYSSVRLIPLICLTYEHYPSFGKETWQNKTPLSWDVTLQCYGTYQHIQLSRNIGRTSPISCKYVDVEIASHIWEWNGSMATIIFKTFSKFSMSTAAFIFFSSWCP